MEVAGCGRRVVRQQRGVGAVQRDLAPYHRGQEDHGREQGLNEADACIKAKQQLLDARTDEAPGLAERRVRLLCAD